MFISSKNGSRVTTVAQYENRSIKPNMILKGTLKSLSLLQKKSVIKEVADLLCSLTNFLETIFLSNIPMLPPHCWILTPVIYVKKYPGKIYRKITKVFLTTSGYIYPQ